MNVNLFTQSILFHGITAEELKTLLPCLQAEKKSFAKGETIYHMGDQVRAMGFVVTGGVNIENDDAWGNRSILGHIGSGQIFAETYACLPEEPLMVSVVATEQTEVLFLNTLRLLQTCSNACPHHGTLIRNLLFVTAQKNLNLSQRILHTSSKSIRGRLISYLSAEAARCGSSTFSIPFNRQQLADYLGVDRSALSNELSKMRRDGLLTIDEKKRFHLNQS